MIRTSQFSKLIARFLVVVYFFPLGLNAASPLVISYQGKLANSAGVPLEGTVQSVTFKLYDGSNVLLQTLNKSVTFRNGVFNVLLDVDPQTLQTHSDVYLEMIYNGNAFSPRQKLVAVPYALAVATNSVGTAELQANAVTDEKIVTLTAGKLTGTVDTARLDVSSVTVQGNTFNGADQLLKLNSDGKLPALDGSNLTNMAEADLTPYAKLSGRTPGQTLIGGWGVTDALTLQGTSGNGTLTSPAINFKVGNNGATNAVAVMNNGNVGINTTSPSARLDIQGVGTTTGVSLQTKNSGGNVTFSVLDNGTLSIGTTNSRGFLNVYGTAGPKGDFNGYSGSYNGTSPKGVAMEANFERPISGGVSGSTFKGGVSLGPGTQIYSVNPNPNGSVAYGDIRFAQTYWETDHLVNKDSLVITSGTDNYSTGKVGIGLSSPVAKLDIKGTGTGGNVSLRTQDSGGNVKFSVLDNGNVGIGNASPVEKLEVAGNIKATGTIETTGDTVKITTTKTPSSATATGTTGQMCWDGDYVYVCVAPNTWKRSALTSW